MKEENPWEHHLKEFKKLHPELNRMDIMIQAKETYIPEELYEKVENKKEHKGEIIIETDLLKEDGWLYYTKFIDNKICIARTDIRKKKKSREMKCPHCGVVIKVETIKNAKARLKEAI